MSGSTSDAQFAALKAALSSNSPQADTLFNNILSSNTQQINQAKSNLGWNTSSTLSDGSPTSPALATAGTGVNVTSSGTLGSTPDVPMGIAGSTIIDPSSPRRCGCHSSV